MAVEGQGAYQVGRFILIISVASARTHRQFLGQRTLASPTLTKITMNSLTPSTLPQASFCESVEAAHSDHSTNALIARALGITKPSVRMDSQAKYCSVARGDGDIYLRLPVDDKYEEKIWVRAICWVL